MRKLFLFLFAALMSVGMYATTVTWNNSDMTGIGNSFTKDDVTVNAGMIDWANLDDGSFTTTLGNFTKIEVTAEYCEVWDEGWSGDYNHKTWTGNAASVPFGMFYGISTIVFTIEEPEPTPTPILLTTINSSENADFHSYSKTFDDKAVVTFSRYLQNYEDEWGWFIDEGNATISVTAAEGYTITSCKFYCDEGNAEDTQAPFEAKLYGMSGDFDDIPPHTEVNGNSIGSYGVTKIEVYGYQNSAPAPEDQEITPNVDPEHAGVYYSTFYDSANKYALPAGVEAYVATLDDANLLLSKIADAGQTIPANNAVILKSTVTPFTLSISDAEAVPVNAINSLKGSDVSIATPNNCYVLAGNNGVGFYHYTASMLNPHKAYVIYNGTPNQAPKKMPFVFNGEQTATGVENVQGDNVQSTKVIENGVLYIIKNDVKYNAQGQIVK